MVSQRRAVLCAVDACASPCHCASFPAFAFCVSPPRTGMAIPMLPEKKLIGNQGPEFIEERKRGLISFMNVLTDNPYLRHDHTVRSFLTVAESGAGEWDQAKRAADSGEGSHPSVNMGLNRWFGVLRNYPIPTDADDACATFLLHCNEMEKTARTLLASLNKYFECAVKLSAALNDVHTAMEGFETTAMMGTSSLPSSLADAGEFVGAAASMTNKVGTALGSLKDLSGFAPSEIQVFLVDAIEKEISRVTSVKQLIAMREDALKQYQSAWGKQDKLEYEVKQWTGGPFTSLCVVLDCPVTGFFEGAFISQQPRAAVTVRKSWSRRWLRPPPPSSTAGNALTTSPRASCTWKPASCLARDWRSSRASSGSTPPSVLRRAPRRRSCGRRCWAPWSWTRRPWCVSVSVSVSVPVSVPVSVSVSVSVSLCLCVRLCVRLCACVCFRAGILMFPPLVFPGSR